MKRLLLDVNVVLDCLLDRAPHAGPSLALWTAARKAGVEVYVPAHGVTTVFYLVARAKGPASARSAVGEMLTIATVATVDDAVLRRALALGGRDFEDAVCAAAAEAASCDFLVTRDPGGFKDSPVLVVDPTTALALVRNEPGPPRARETASASRKEGVDSAVSLPGARAAAVRAVGPSPRATRRPSGR